MSPEETLQKWQDYINDYSSKLSVLKTETDAIINSSTATATEKANARKTYELQKAHLDELESKYAQIQTQYQQTGVLPDDITFGESGRLGTFTYKTSVDSNVFTGYARNLPVGSTFVTSEHFNLYFEAGTATWGEYTGSNTTWYGIVVVESAAWAWYNLKDRNAYMANASATGSWSSGTFVGVTVSTTIGDDIITQGTASVSHQFKNGIIINLPQSTVPTSSPWDYYNNELLPEVNDIDPDAAIYPDQYEPTNPYDPPEEPVDVPDDDGEVPPDQLTRNVVGATRFVTQYALNYTELATIGNTLWSSWLTTNTDVWKNFFLPYAQDFGTLNIGAALDFIISLKVFPFAFTDEMAWIGLGDGVRMGTGHTDFLGAESRIIRTLLGYLNGGTCEIPLYYEDFRDIYNTTIIAYLPYCGTVQLNPSEVMGKTLQLYYYIDFQAGSCTAVIKVIGDNTTYNICAKSGQIGFTIPITATNAGQVAAQFIGDATQLFGTIGDYTMGVAKNIPKLATKKNMLSGVLGITENIGSAAASIIDEGLGIVSRSGVDVPMLSGGAGIESFKLPSKAYIQVRRGKYGKPNNYPHSKGFVNDSSGIISSFGESGTAFCVFTGVDTTGLKCNDAERAEILSLLQSGVYV